MAKRKKDAAPKRKSTIGTNPLERLEPLGAKGGKKAARFKGNTAQAEIKEVLLQRPKSEGTISRWLRSVFG